MSDKKIVFVVGHKSWGKSRTLKSLTNENFRIRKTKIANVEFFIRRMSNDDQSESYFNFMKSLNPETRPHLIAALCPQFDDLDVKTNLILTMLQKKGYQLFFWVIEHQHGSLNVIKPKEIERLKEFGTVEVFTEKNNPAARAKTFEQFVSKVAIS